MGLYIRVSSKGSTLFAFGITPGGFSF